MFLRVRTFIHQPFQVYHVHCNFILGYICRILSFCIGLQSLANQKNQIFAKTSNVFIYFVKEFKGLKFYILRVQMKFNRHLENATL